MQIESIKEKYNNSHFKYFFDRSVKELIKIFEKVVIEKSPVKDSSYAHHVKYSLSDYVIGILDVLKHSYSWNTYSGIVNGNTLRKKHNEWVKLDIYREVYDVSLDKFCKNVPKTKEFKYQSIDSTFIADVNGCKESKYNPVYKCKKGSATKGIKVTTVTTTNGIPISTHVTCGTNHDSKLLPVAVSKIAVNCNTYKYRNHNRYKQYFLGDSGYDSKQNIKLLLEKGYKPIIKSNPRGTKKKHLIRRFNKQENEIYKKRIIIENYHSWIKKFPKIKSIHEKLLHNYVGLLFLGMSMIISRRLVRVKK